MKFCKVTDHQRFVRCGPILVGSGGHVLGYGDATGTSRDNKGKPSSLAADMENELMDIEESERNREEEMSHSDDSSSDSDEEGPGHINPPMIPPMPGNMGFPPAFGLRGRPPWGPRLQQFPGLGDDDDEMFEGEGHRLGGKEVPPIAGDLQIPGLKMHGSGTV